MPKELSNRLRMKAVVPMLFVMCIVAGCSPATQPLTNTDVTQGAKVQSSNWDPVVKAVDLGLEATMYKEYGQVQFVQGTSHTNFSVYGSIQGTDRTNIGLHENASNAAFYQQGKSAFAEDNAHWIQSPALSNVNVFPAYARIVDLASSRGVAIMHSTKPVFVNGEYCDVYRAYVPADLDVTLPYLQHGVPRAQQGLVQYDFYVGQTSKELRQVQTTSNGLVDHVGPVEITSTMTLFDFNQDVAQVTPPYDLILTFLNQEGQ